MIVNRLWHHLFGVGIVRTVDNFGANGERPSHPELLDCLAVDLIDNNWSIKSLIRKIVLSRTYRQASTYCAIAFLRDPGNRLLWRARKRRLDAEALRDAMLAVSSQLDTARPVGSLVSLIGDRPISLLAFDKRVPADLDGSRHRSVYLPVIRDRLPDALELFDCAEPSLVTITTRDTRFGWLAEESAAGCPTAQRMTLATKQCKGEYTSMTGMPRYSTCWDSITKN